MGPGGREARVGVMIGYIVGLALAAGPGAGWTKVVDGDVKVFTREAGERVKEVRAESVIDAPPGEVREVLLDEEFTRKSHYVREYRILQRPDPLTLIKYVRLHFPLIEDRDCFFEVHLDSDLAADGSGVFHSSWKPWGLDRPGRSGVVRVKVNQGYWELRATDDGKSAVSYYILTDPGGALPAWVINAANTKVAPDVLRDVAAEVQRRHAIVHTSAQVGR